MTYRQLVFVELLVLNVVAVLVLLALLAAAHVFEVPGHAPTSSAVEQVAVAPAAATPAIVIIPIVATREPVLTLAPTGTPTRTPTATPVPPQIAARYLSDYLQNRTYADVTEGRPWANTSLNVWQYTQELGGVTFWDYFASKFGQGFDEDWDSERYGWLDERGAWQSYRTETIKDVRGRDATAYVLVDRTGPGVVDKMVFTQYSVAARRGDTSPDLAEWGYLTNLGRLRIQIDGKPVYDIPIAEWFSGNALCLAPDLARLFFWRYRDFGSNGAILPIPYQNSIRISVYGGTEKPKWFTVTGVTLPAGLRVTPLGGCLDGPTQNALRGLASNVTAPERYLQSQNLAPVTLTLAPRPTGSSGARVSASGAPSLVRLPGAGTLTALQFGVSKDYDLAAIDVRLAYGDEPGVTVPLMALFSDQDRLVRHRSAPMGVIDDPDDARLYLFYLNYPLPYRNGLTIELTTRAGPATVQVVYTRSAETANAQFRLVYQDYKARPSLPPLGPDYTIKLPGDGKLVGLVLTTRDYEYNARTIPAPPADLVRGAGVFPMGYMESNVTLRDGRGAARIYSGLEDFADGGYDFDSDEGPGAKNLPFAGVLGFAWDPPERGYFTIFRYWNDLSAFRFKQGLDLAIQHGTWRNNYRVRYGIVVMYYAE